VDVLNESNENSVESINELCHKLFEEVDMQQERMNALITLRGEETRQVGDENLSEEMLRYEVKDNVFVYESWEQLQVEMNALEHAIYNGEDNDFPKVEMERTLVNGM
ncbi:hypothetical protein KI387_042959, partial [Taxus chinensis]